MNTNTHPKTIICLSAGAILLLVILYFVTHGTAHSALPLSATTLSSFSYPDFSSTSNLILLDSASPVNNALRLSPGSVCCQRGGAWRDTKQPVQDGFQTTFQFQIANLNGGGGDGFAFVIQNSSDQALGDAGCGMGYDGIPNSVVIEFDTFKNPPYCEAVGDLDANHISVQTNGTGENSVEHSYSLGRTSPSVNFKDGQPHTVSVRYAPNTMRIYLDDMVTPVLTVNIDLATTLSLDNGAAWVGFVAASGTSYESHDILSWQFSTGQVDAQIFCDGRTTPQNFGELCEESLQVQADVSGDALPDSIDVQIFAMNTCKQTTLTLQKTSGSIYRASIPVSQVASELTGDTAAAIVTGSDNYDYNVATQFLEDMGISEENRLGIAFGAGDQANNIPPDNLNFLKAAGYEQIFVMPTVGTSEGAWGFVKHQADILLYIGHGSHSLNQITLDDQQSMSTPRHIGSAWEDGLDTVVLFGCSVLDIEDQNNWWGNGHLGREGSADEHRRSPGRSWIELGPQKWFGFQHYAPLVNIQDGDEIMFDWADSYVASGDKEPRDTWWRDATDNSSFTQSKSAVMIDRGDWAYHYWDEKITLLPIFVLYYQYEWKETTFSVLAANIEELDGLIIPTTLTHLEQQQLDAADSAFRADALVVQADLYDALGNHLGPDGAGGFEAEIPGSSVRSSYLVGSLAPGGANGQGISVLGADLSHGYDLRLAGTGEGNFHFLLEIPDQASGQIYHVSYVTVPVTSTTILSLTLQTGADFTLALDADGDGVFEGQVPAAGITTTLDLPAGAIAAWPFDEAAGTIAHDRTLKHNDGLLIGGPAWTQGFQESGLAFDGQDDRVVVSSTESLNLLTTTLTLEAWVSPANVDGEQILISRWGEETERSYQLSLDDGHLHALLSPDGSKVVDLGVSTGMVSSNTWSHVAFASNGQKAWYFINGVQEAITLSPPATVYTSTHPLFLGGSADGVSGGLAGKLDEVKIYLGSRTDYAPLAQSDWKGGPGQAIWNGNDPTRYDSASTGIDDSMIGQLRLKGASVGDTVVYSPTGVLTSSVFDAGRPVFWTEIDWTGWITAGASLEMAISYSDDGITWTEWMTLTPQFEIGLNQAVLPEAKMARMARYQVRLTASSDGAFTPVLYNATLFARSPNLCFLPLIVKNR